MPQPNQFSFTRSQIRRLARTGGLTPEVVARIEAAAKRGQVIDDISTVRGTIPRTPPEAALQDEAPPPGVRRAGSELGGLSTPEPEPPPSMFLSGRR